MEVECLERMARGGPAALASHDLLGLHLDAPALTAALARCPEAVCRRYLPHGRRQDRYWIADDLHGAKGRSLLVRPRPASRRRPPRPAPRWKQ